MNDSDVSFLKQRQEIMRTVLKQQQNQNLTQQHSQLNPDDENLLISLVEIPNQNNSKQIFEKSLQHASNDQTESLQINCQHEEVDFNLRQFDFLASPNNKTKSICSDIKLDILNDNSTPFKQNIDGFFLNKMNRFQNQNTVLSSIKEATHNSVSEESNQGSNTNKWNAVQFTSQKIQKNEQEISKNSLGDQQNLKKIQNNKKISFNKLSFMGRLKISKKFINKMKMNVRNILSKNLSSSQHEIIGDNSSDYDVYIFQEKYQNEDSALKYFDYIIFFKYLDIPNKLNELETKLHISESAQNWLKLIKLEIIVIVLAHVAGCIYLRIGLSEQNLGRNCWITQFQLTSKLTSELYLVSFYYMIISMVTIGYGDFYPTTMYERGYIVIVALIATNVCAYSFSQISEIVKFEEAKKENFNQMMRNINQQMKQNKISMILQQKVRKFHEYYYYSLNKKKDQTDKIVEQLPIQMKFDYFLEKNQELINQVHIFKILSRKCIEQVCCKIQQKILTSDQILLEQNTPNECLYFINKGELDVYITTGMKKEKQQLQKVLTLTNSDVIGYEGFLLGQQNYFQVKSQGDTIVSFIEWPKFLEILKQFPDDLVAIFKIFLFKFKGFQIKKEKIFHLRDKTIYGYPGISTLKLKCVSCSSYDHQYDECPFINFRKRYKDSYENNIRQQQVRNKKLKSSTFQNIFYTQRQAMIAQINNGGSIISDAISCLNSDSQQGKENIQLRSKSSWIQSNQSEVEEQSISQSQVQQLQPDLKKTQSQIQKQNESSDNTFKQQQQNMIEKQDTQNTQNKIRLQYSIESPSFKKRTAKALSESNDMQSRNEVQIQSTKQKAQTYNQEGSNRNIEIDDQNKLTFNQSLINSKILSDASPLSKRYSKTAENIIQQMRQQSLISPLIKIKNQKGQEENKQNENSSKKSHSELLLELVFKKRKRKASKLYQLKLKQISERLAQKKQSIYSNQQEENIAKLINEMLIKYENQDQIQQLNAAQILNQIAHQKQLSFMQSEQNNLIKDCIEKSKREFQISPIQVQNQFNQSPMIISQVNQNEQIDNLSPNSNTEQLILQSLAPEEAMIRTRLNIQDIDLLRVRKVYLLLQQQNKNSINNLIEVPDNEMDIDQMKDYNYYYPNQNCQNILWKIKNRKLQIQLQKDKIQQTIKKTKQSLKKNNRISLPSTRASEQFFSTKLNQKNNNLNIY